MKIAFVCTDRGPCPPVRGGAIQLLIAKVTPLLARKHQVIVLSITDVKLPEHETVQGVKYIRLGPKNFLRKVCIYLKQEKVDIVQLYNRPAWVNAIGKAVPQAGIVLSLHNRLHDLKMKGQLKANLKRADKILTVSKFIKNDTLKKVPLSKQKFEVVYTGADFEEYAPLWSEQGKKWRDEIRKRYSLGAEEAVVLFVGRLVSYKGCGVVLEALMKKLGKGKRVAFLIVGSKWYADNTKDEYVKYLEKRAKQARNKIIFTKYVPVVEMPKYYAAADLFVNASQWQEPLARVHYEAMATGLPIITTNRGGNQEVIKQQRNGIIVKEHKNYQHFRKAIKEILFNPQKARRMGKKGRKMVEQIYNFERVAQDLEAIYAKLLKRKKLN